uniref:Uncharacterized protein n=1 Tax=Arundo donax TaxID=35708 RepID=A0A0A9G551_ARUDO
MTQELTWVMIFLFWRKKLRILISRSKH